MPPNREAPPHTAITFSLCENFWIRSFTLSATYTLPWLSTATAYGRLNRPWRDTPGERFVNNASTTWWSAVEVKLDRVAADGEVSDTDIVDEALGRCLKRSCSNGSCPSTKP